MLSAMCYAAHIKELTRLKQHIESLGEEHEKKQTSALEEAKVGAASLGIETELISAFCVK